MLVILLIVGCQGQYDVPSYYGHFSYNYFLPNELLSGSLTYFELHYAMDMDYDNKTVFYANDHFHVVYAHSLQTGMTSLIAGIQHQSGNNIGKTKNAQFLKCNSLTYYQKNVNNQKQATKSQLYLVKDQSCNLNDDGCILTSPYPKLAMQNIRIEPKIILFPELIPQQQEYLYVADRGNHCIKRVSLHQGIVDVIGGKCGQAGFRDGPFQYNRLNLPAQMGINTKGVLFFFDEGNRYMRKITPDLMVSTLLNGACKQYGLSRSIKTHKMKTILCYENWIEGVTKGPIQHFYQPIDICFKHASECK